MYGETLGRSARREPPNLGDPGASRHLLRGQYKGRNRIRFLLLHAAMAVVLGITGRTASAQAVAEKPGSAPTAKAAKWLIIPRIAGRLTPQNVGLVINEADPYSVEVGEYYQRMRGIAPEHVLRLRLPTRANLSADEFATFKNQVDRFFHAPVQALALAWVTPYAVACNSITGALALGFDAQLCNHPCSESRRSPYFDNASLRPASQLGVQISMLLAAKDIATAKAMIRRGIDADGTLGKRGAPPSNAWFLQTNDSPRNVRVPLFPPAGLLRNWNVDVHVEQAQVITNMQRVLIYETGAVTVPGLNTLGWLPGALADHLTSFGGVLEGGTGQMSILDWISSGATASYGTVSEPCAIAQKFPQPQVLLGNYLQGATAIEAYWRSVAWPQQGLFIGEPLAAPFAAPSARR